MQQLLLIAFQEVDECQRKMFASYTNLHIFRGEAHQICIFEKYKCA